LALNHNNIALEEMASSLLADKAMYNYIGIFDQASADKVILEVNDLLNHHDYSLKIRKKAFCITIEVVQNLFNYLCCNDVVYNKGIFLIHNNINEVAITSGNYIRKTEVNSIKSRIDLINCLTSEELRHFYRRLLEISSFSIQDAGGAGLGFVDIAKKSGNKIEYDFLDIDNEYVFYIFKIII